MGEPPRYGDNIFALGSLVGQTLRLAKWDRCRIDAILASISAAENYDAAVTICAQYITIKSNDHD